METIA